MTPTLTAFAAPGVGAGHLETARRRPGMKAVFGALALAASPLAVAHEGHGMAPHHWHATDALGFVVLAVAVGLVLWATRRK
jgi:hypothetical protein